MLVASTQHTSTHSCLIHTAEAGRHEAAITEIPGERRVTTASPRQEVGAVPCAMADGANIAPVTDAARNNMGRSAAAKMWVHSCIREGVRSHLASCACDEATTAAADQSTSGGLTNSGFIEWLCEQREMGKFLDYMEFQRPETRFGA